MLNEHTLVGVDAAVDPNNKYYLNNTGGSAARPMALMFFGLSYKFAGMSSLPYTLTIRLIHCIVSICTFYLICKLTRNTLIALFSALLYASFYVFSITLLSTEILADSFLTFFGTLTLLSYLKYIETNKSIYRLATALSLLMALLAKEPAIVLPPLIIVIDFYYRHEKLGLLGLLKDVLSLEGVKKYGIYVLVCILYLVFIATAGDWSPFGLVTSGLRTKGIPSMLNILLYTIHYAVTPTFVWNTLLTKIFGLFYAISVLVLFYYSDTKARNIMFFLACSTGILLLPSGLYDLQDRYLYFPAVFTTAFIA